MDSINPLNRLAEILRRRVSVEGGEYRQGQAKATPGSTARGEGRLSVQTLRGEILRSIKAIDVNDPTRQTKSMTLLVESIVTWQFGSALLSDQSFHELVAEVRDALLRDPCAEEMLRKLLEGE